MDTSLELIPQSIVRHPAILKDAKRRKKKPGEMILDDSKHHSAMKSLEKKEKRGRPDIIHQNLLLALDSTIKDLEIFIHTINDEIIWINRETRIPRNYYRFIGVMEDLFKKREIRANEKVLLKIMDANLESLLEDFKVLVLSERGDMGEDYMRSVFRSEDKIAVCIGAFPHGDFEDKTINILRDHNADFVSLADRPLTSLYITCKVLCIYECERVRTD